MNPPPLVTVICLCYNHARFVREAIESVLNQTYSNIQIVVVDDASTDNSVEVIKKVTGHQSAFEFLFLTKNVGNCRAFNKGLALAKGKYVIDFATDDVLMPDRIEKQVTYFEKLDDDYGVVFTDAEYIDEQSKRVRNHYEYLFKKRLINHVPQGNVFSFIIRRYFVASPTMMVRKSVLDVLNGYDEELAYEDFDFWVRSSRISQYGFIDEKLTRIRLSTTSMSKGWYKIGDKQVHSTYLVCRKLMKLIQNQGEKESLLVRIRYELRQCTFSHNTKEALLFFDMLKELSGVRVIDQLWLVILKSGIPVAWMRSLYHQVRFS